MRSLRRWNDSMPGWSSLGVCERSVVRHSCGSFAVDAEVEVDADGLLSMSMVMVVVLLSVCLYVLDEEDGCVTVAVCPPSVLFPVPFADPVTAPLSLSSSLSDRVTITARHCSIPHRCLCTGYQNTHHHLHAVLTMAAARHSAAIPIVRPSAPSSAVSSPIKRSGASVCTQRMHA